MPQKLFTGFSSWVSFAEGRLSFFELLVSMCFNPFYVTKLVMYLNNVSKLGRRKMYN